RLERRRRGGGSPSSPDPYCTGNCRRITRSSPGGRRTLPRYQRCGRRRGSSRTKILTKRYTKESTKSSRNGTRSTERRKRPNSK
ncbi:hypothetical protein PFISCL1PPCAC_27877, partial [Pristionchus fissidentatus]